MLNTDTTGQAFSLHIVNCFLARTTIFSSFVFLFSILYF